MADEIKYSINTWKDPTLFSFYVPMIFMAIVFLILGITRDEIFSFGVIFPAIFIAGGYIAGYKKKITINDDGISFSRTFSTIFIWWKDVASHGAFRQWISTTSGVTVEEASLEAPDVQNGGVKYFYVSTDKDFKPNKRGQKMNKTLIYFASRRGALEVLQKHIPIPATQ